MADTSDFEDLLNKLQAGADTASGTPYKPLSSTYASPEDLATAKNAAIDQGLYGPEAQSNAAIGNAPTDIPHSASSDPKYFEDLMDRYKASSTPPPVERTIPIEPIVKPSEEVSPELAKTLKSAEIPESGLDLSKYAEWIKNSKLGKAAGTFGKVVEPIIAYNSAKDVASELGKDTSKMSEDEKQQHQANLAGSALEGAGGLAGTLGTAGTLAGGAIGSGTLAAAAAPFAAAAAPLMAAGAFSKYMGPSLAKGGELASEQPGGTMMPRLGNPDAENLPTPHPQANLPTPTAVIDNHDGNGPTPVYQNPEAPVATDDDAEKIRQFMQGSSANNPEEDMGNNKGVVTREPPGEAGENPVPPSPQTNTQTLSPEAQKRAADISNMQNNLSMLRSQVAPAGVPTITQQYQAALEAQRKAQMTNGILRGVQQMATGLSGMGTKGQLNASSPVNTSDKMLQEQGTEQAAAPMEQFKTGLAVAQEDPNSPIATSMRSIMSQQLTKAGFKPDLLNGMSYNQMVQLFPNVTKMMDVQETGKLRQAQNAALQQTKAAAAEQKTTDKQNDNYQKLTKDIETFRGNKTASDAETSLRQIKNAMSMINSGVPLNKQDWDLLAGEMSKIATGAAATQSGIKGLMPRTFGGDVLNAVQYMSGHPTQTDQQDFANRYGHYLSNITDNSLGVVNDYKGQLAAGHMDQIRPDQREDFFDRNPELVPYTKMSHDQIVKYAKDHLNGNVDAAKKILGDRVRKDFNSNE